MLVTAVLSCSGCSARVQTPSRIQTLASAQPDTARMFALLQEEAAESDGTLAAILAAEGKPDRIDVNHWNTGDYWAVEIQLYYGASRRLVVFRRDLNQPWYAVRNEVVSRLAAYKDKDTIEAYEEYLRLFSDDPADALAFTQNRIRELEEQQRRVEAQRKAIARMEDFVRHHPKPGTTTAYEDYLKKIHPDDLARATALERLDALRYEPYKAKGTRAARREFVTKYPDSATAHRLNQEEILEGKGEASFTNAVRAVEELGSATSVGLNFSEYSRRLVDARIRVDQALSEARDRVPVTAGQEIREAILDYQEAMEVWNVKIENVSVASRDGSYPYDERFTDIVAWLNACPVAVRSRPGSFLPGSWVPEVVMQCYWAKARVNVGRAKRYLSP